MFSGRSERVPRACSPAAAFGFAIALVVPIVGGCSGDIGSSGSPGGPGSGSGSGSTGSGNGTGTGSGTGGSNVGGPAPTDPGRVTMHRLNLAEYDNTMRDLLGTTTHPSVDFNFPVDDRGADFDNTSDVLTVSPLHLSCYNSAATSLVSAALSNTAQRSKLVGCDLVAGGAACARTSLEAFLPRAWRRPVDSSEVDRLMALVTMATTQGDSVETGFALALRAALLSPNFTYRPEIDADPKSTTPHPLNDYELASRLSYFIWSSMPDDALFSAAKVGNLHQTSVLGAQVTRMLADPKAQALVDNFAGQWLYIRKVDEADPDPTMFPQFDASLRAALKSETQLLFREVVFNNLPADQLLTAKFTFANDRLAQFYGLPKVNSTDPVRVDLTGNAQRGGFLTQASFLTVNAHADRTSPVLRGKYVLTELLCEDIPPPPPTVNTMIMADPTGATTLRQVLTAHINNPTCAACHTLMDPIGFGMENYNAIGAYRTTDGKLPIDSTGMLSTGEHFNGLMDLTQIIGRNAAFPGCMTSKLYSYALGRAIATDPKNMDTTAVPALASTFNKSGLKFPDLVTALVNSPTFLNRRGEGVSP